MVSLAQHSTAQLTISEKEYTYETFTTIKEHFGYRIIVPKETNTWSNFKITKVFEQNSQEAFVIVVFEGKIQLLL